MERLTLNGNAMRYVISQEIELGRGLRRRYEVFEVRYGRRRAYVLRVGVVGEGDSGGIRIGDVRWPEEFPTEEEALGAFREAWRAEGRGH
jgi:hypothetical protein